MKYTHILFAIVLGTSWIACTNTLNNACGCPEKFEHFVSQQTPLETDTVLIVDPTDYSRECYETTFYSVNDPGAEAVTVHQTGDKEVRCLVKGDCSLLWSVRTQIACPR